MGADVMTQLLRISLIGGMTGDEMSAKVLSFSGGLGSEGALNFDQLAEGIAAKLGWILCNVGVIKQLSQ